MAWVENASGAKGQIWIAAANGAKAHAVTEPIDALGQIEWLPGNKLIYWADFSLFRLTPGGRSSVFSPVAGGDFSIDTRGTRVATGSPGCPRCAGPIVIRELANGAARRIGGKNEEDTSPALSANGSWVAFSRAFCESDGYCDRPAGIWVSATKGGRLRRVTRRGGCPSWSPDGRRLAYVDVNDRSVRLVSARGGTGTVLIRGSDCDSSLPPRWSHDSRSVAVVAGPQRQLVIVDVATRRSRPLTGLAVGAVIDVSWSTDSSTLLVAGRPTPRSCSSLWTVNAKSGAAHLLRDC
jgi:Tol biopolymer transport system component